MQSLLSDMILEIAQTHVIYVRCIQTAREIV